ncbi:MAG: type toxin-antitoxin system RelE/ParE family toxin [Candidatus Angelobacter sp.]|nr:type toxin-antitoxin system RelE/ParE family toxin [Candidatus Angelobacter sp.]
MAWTVEVGDFAEKQLRKLDAPVRDRILHYLADRIQGCKNPRHFGESLKGNKAGWWRYRVGDYRVICRIQDEKITVLVLAIGHRREIYR